MNPIYAWGIAVALCCSGNLYAQCVVRDIFGRDLATHGLTLVDWDGYLANPLLTFYLYAPTNAVLPGSATLSADGSRLYFDSPSEVQSAGPRKTVSLSNASTPVPFRLSIFPDRDGANEDYTLTMVFTDANNTRRTNTLPIHVLDLDQQRTNEFPVLVNFDRDITGFFEDASRREVVSQSAADWGYFFGDMRLDPVVAGSETTFIWSNNFNGGYYFTSTNTYTGYQLYAYGTTNEVHRSGGEGSYSGPVQTSNGIPLSIKRSGGFEAEIYGNYNALGWLATTNDEDWLVTGNYGNETNDLYSISHHEIGHALIFNPAHPGFNAAKSQGAFTSQAVTNYYGGPVPIDPFDHLNGILDPESGQGAFGYEYYGDIPRRRWLITKLDLLCAAEVGYLLRDSSAFAPLTLPIVDPLIATASLPFNASYTAAGGIPVYCWDIVDGTLPPGLSLDSFTGTISGVPSIAGDFSFTLRVRDYHPGSPGVQRSTAIHVAPAPAFRLTAVTTDQAQVQVTVEGTSGQRQVVELSTDLLNWSPFATNTSGTNHFEVLVTNSLNAGANFFRARAIQ